MQPASSAPAAQYVVCVGAAKAGTTTLYTLMSRHPEVAVSTVKETDFYRDERFYGIGFERYLSEYFDPRPGVRVLFEADPVYMYAPRCIERLHASAPHARVIIMLRNPVDRAYSQYRYRMLYGRYRESFAEMCVAESARVRESEMSRMEYGCLDRSRYAAQIERILRYFPREQLHFIVFENFVRSQRGEFASVCRWLGLSEIDVGEARENPGGKARSVLLARLLYHPGNRWLRGVVGRLLVTAPLRRRVYGLLGRLNLRARDDDDRDEERLDPQLRRSLLDVFSDEIVAVERLTGLDLELWRRA